MTELFALIMSYVSIWAPSLAAIVGIAFTVLIALGKMKSTIDDFKKDKTIEDLCKKIDELTAQNAAEHHANKLLVDEFTKIKDYVDKIKKED